MWRQDFPMKKDPVFAAFVRKNKAKNQRQARPSDHRENYDWYYRRRRG